MGTFKNTAITRDVRNSVGDQTFCKWKGLQIVKQKVGNNTSNTDAQQMQRKRWQTGMELDALFAAATTSSRALTGPTSGNLPQTARGLCRAR